MSLLFALKVLSDLCLYFTLAGAVGLWCGQTMVLLWPGLLLASAAGLAAGLAERRPRNGLHLLPTAACLLFPHSIFDWIVLVPAIVYVLFLISRKRFSVIHGHFLDTFTRGLIFAGAALLFCLVGADLKQAAAYAAGYVLIGVFLLRQLRLGHCESWRERLLNLSGLLAVLALCGLLCFILWSGIQLPFQHLFLWFFYLLWYVFRVAVSLLNHVKLAAAAPAEEQTQVFRKFDLPSFSMETMRRELNPDNALILGVLLAVGFAVGAFFLLRRMLRTLRKNSGSTTRRVWTEPLRPTASGRPLAATDRDRLRRVYRKFLELLRSRDVSLSQTQTTAQIHRAAIHAADPESAGLLRRLYLPARYDSAAEIGPEQVREARRLLRQLEKTDKFRKK